MKVMIVCADGLEECEALVTYDLLFRAGIEVDLVGLKEDVISSHLLHFQVDKTIQEINYEEYDCLILPGGMPGVKNLSENKILDLLIDKFIQEDKYICAICAAPSILINKGLLKDEEFNCYPGFENNLKPNENNVVIKDKIITAKALGSAFEFGHAIISELLNKEKADEVFNQIYYH